MSDDSRTGDARNDPRSDGRPKNPPNTPPARSKQKKSILDITNIVGAFVWLITAIMGNMVATNIFVPVPPTCRAADLMIEPSCVRSQVFTSTYFLPVFVLAFVVQIIITIMSRRVHNRNMQRGIFYTELFINLVGFYWIVCVQLGYAGKVRTAGKTLVPIFTDMGTFVVLMLLIGGSWLLYYLPNVCWDQPGTPTQAPQQNQKQR